MANQTIIRDDIAEQQLAALELRYRQTQDNLTEARALYANYGVSAQTDDPGARRAKARVQHLQAKLAELQRSMELLEE